MYELNREAHEHIGHAMNEIQDAIELLDGEAQKRHGEEKQEAKRLKKLAETIFIKMVYLWEL